MIFEPSSLFSSSAKCIPCSFDTAESKTEIFRTCDSIPHYIEISLAIGKRRLCGRSMIVGYLPTLAQQCGASTLPQNHNYEGSATQRAASAFDGNFLSIPNRGVAASQIAHLSPIICICILRIPYFLVSVIALQINFFLQGTFSTKEKIHSLTMATDDVMIPQHVGISEAPRDVEAIRAQEKASILPYWNPDVAFKLGYNLRTRLLTQERPAVVDISTISTPPHVLFHAVSTHSHYYLDRDRLRNEEISCINN